MKLDNKKNIWILKNFSINNKLVSKAEFEKEIQSRERSFINIKTENWWETINIKFADRKIENVFLFNGRYFCCFEKNDDGKYTVYSQNYFTKKYNVDFTKITGIEKLVYKKANLLSIFLPKSVWVKMILTKEKTSKK